MLLNLMDLIARMIKYLSILIHVLYYGTLVIALL